MLLVVSPLKMEQKGLLQALSHLGFESERTDMQGVLAIPDLKLSFVVGGLGKAQFALQTQHYLHHLPDIEAVFCIGAAGSLSGDVKPLDIVLGESTIEHDFRNRFVVKPPPVFAGDERWLERFRTGSEKLGPAFSVHVGVIASGDEDIVTRERAEELSRETGALAVAWEGAGGARAARFNQLPYVEIRAVTDLANEDAQKHFADHLDQALTHVAQLLVAVLSVRT